MPGAETVSDASFQIPIRAAPSTVNERRSAWVFMGDRSVLITTTPAGLEKITPGCFQGVVHNVRDPPDSAQSEAQANLRRSAEGLIELWLDYGLVTEPTDEPAEGNGDSQADVSEQTDQTNSNGGGSTEQYGQASQADD